MKDEGKTQPTIDPFANGPDENQKETREDKAERIGRAAEKRVKKMGGKALPLDVDDFELGGTRFIVGKLNALDGDEALTTYVFPALKKWTDGLKSFNPTNDIELIVEIAGTFLSCIEREYYGGLQKMMFERIRFQKKRGGAVRYIDEAPEVCFEGLEPIHVFMLTTRAFIVNFIGSYREIPSLIPSSLLSTPRKS